MERYVEELEDMLPEEKEYLKNLVKKRACEKTIELAIESMIDVCAMLVSFQKLGMPTDEDNIFDILVRKKVIHKNMSEKLRAMKGFRNIIVHKYGEVKDELTYEFLSTKLNDFKEFKETCIKYLKKNITIKK